MRRFDQTIEMIRQWVEPPPREPDYWLKQRMSRTPRR